MPKRKEDSPREIKAAWARFARSNRLAAEVILANRNRYAGLPVIWAERWRRNNPK